MEKVINFYETLFIVDTAAGDEQTKATVEKFKTLISDNASVESVNEWGRRRLAYPINDKPDGYYVLVYFKSEPSFPPELERRFSIDESIMRAIVVKLDEKKMSKLTASVPPEVVTASADDDADAKPAAAPVAEAAEAPAPAEAPAADETKAAE